MKRLSTIALLISAVFILSSCGNAASAGDESQKNNETASLEVENTSEQGSNSPELSSADKALIVYFSMPETTSGENMTQDEENSVVVIDGQVLGNTQYVAALIQEQTQADIFRIEPKAPYPMEHEELVSIAEEERTNNVRPELKSNIENLDNYDTVFVGYPIWWSDFPMIMYTFFDENDFAGKTIIPFNTHGGSGLAGTVKTIKELEPNAQVSDNAFSVSRNDVQNCKDDLDNWLNELGY